MDYVRFRNFLTFVKMNFMSGGNSFYRLLLYLFYNIVSNFPTKKYSSLKILSIEKLKECIEEE